MESDQAQGPDSGAAAPPETDLDPRQRFRVKVATWFADTPSGESPHPSGGGPATFRLDPTGRYGRQPKDEEVLMPTGTEVQVMAASRLRHLARADIDVPLPRVIRHAFMHAGQLRDEGMSKEVEDCIERLIGGSW